MKKARHVGHLSVFAHVRQKILYFYVGFSESQVPMSEGHN